MESTTPPQPDEQVETSDVTTSTPLPTAEDQLRRLETQLSGTQELQKLEEDRKMLSNEEEQPSHTDESPTKS